MAATAAHTSPAVSASVILNWISVWSLCASLGLILFLLLKSKALYGSSIKLTDARNDRIKTLLCAALIAVEFIGLINLFGQSFGESLARSINFAAICSIWSLSRLEHRHSVRPSSPLTLFLLASIAVDAAQFLLRRILSPDAGVPSLLLARICAEMALVIAECQNKTHLLKPEYQQLPPQCLAGFLSTTFFWWLNDLVFYHGDKLLNGGNIPSLDTHLESRGLRDRICRLWESRTKPESKFTLPKILFRSLLWPILAAVPARLLLIVFRYSQPLLIDYTINYVNKKNLSPNSTTGHIVVIATAFIYIGMAVSTAAYEHRLNRIKAMIRGSLSGRAITLMSTDVDSLDSTVEMLHEIWAQIFEVTIGMIMLIQQIGWISLALLIGIFGCSRVSRYVSSHLGPKQRAWNAATQDRISMTGTLLSFIKSVKMAGLARPVAARIENLRNREINMANKLRWVMVMYNASANALGIYSPSITLVLFAILSKIQGHGNLEADTAFTTVAILTMVTHPANMIMTILPRIVASLANYQRVQEYLLEPSLQDQRKLGPISQPDSDDFGAAIVLSHATVQPASSLEPILKDVNLEVNKGSIVICSGLTATGKTTLARAITGQVNLVSGSVLVSSNIIGICTQAPFLPNGTVKDIICDSHGQGIPESDWYDTVVRACCLDRDLQALPSGDDTKIGSRGMNLSGGQRQRLALARALYSRCEILVLDDPFSALDGTTEQLVVQHLLGPQGLFRATGVTVFLIDNTVRHFPLADRVIVLGDSEIKLQGPWTSIKSDLAPILKNTLKDEPTKNVEDVKADAAKAQSRDRDLTEAAGDIYRKAGELTIYGYYIQSTGAFNFGILLCCAASYSYFLTIPQYWLKWWTQAGANDTWYYIMGYLFLSTMAWITTNGITWSTLLKVAPTSGTYLHRTLLKTITGAHLTYFFVTNTGTILNRFGQDIQLVDRRLPSALSAFCVQIFKLCLQSTLLFSGQPLMVSSLPLCVCAVYFVQKYYLYLSRQLQYLELESQAAVVTCFLETTEGIATIRSFGWRDRYAELCNESLDNSQRFSYLLLCLQVWLNIVLDLLIASIAVGVMLLVVVMKDTTTGTQVGIALNMILAANKTLLRLVETWTTVEVSLGAIARLKALDIGTPQEDLCEEDYKPTDNWPSSGHLILKDVQAAYNNNSIALRAVDLVIQPGQKVVICGRTGSGKSTLLLALLRLLDLQTGSIEVDGIDIARVPRWIIREKCFITVPQDAVLLPDASLRFNIDPWGIYSDEQIVFVLEKTRLWSHLSKQDGSEGQNTAGRCEHVTSSVFEQPLGMLTPLSAGQLQLLSIARAILRSLIPSESQDSEHPKPILLLDEATSSIDPETEVLIHDLIQELFTDKGFTVIIVAHRINAVAKGMRAGIDIVIRMSEGRIEKFGTVDEMVTLEE